MDIFIFCSILYRFDLKIKNKILHKNLGNFEPIKSFHSFVSKFERSLGD